MQPQVKQARKLLKAEIEKLRQQQIERSHECNPELAAALSIVLKGRPTQELFAVIGEDAWNALRYSQRDENIENFLKTLNSELIYVPESKQIANLISPAGIHPDTRIFLKIS